MKVDYVLLCDKATLREGLLHVLGGGIRALYRPSFPAPMAVDAVIGIQVSNDELREQHGAEIVVQDHDAKRTLIKANVKWETVGDPEAQPGYDPQFDQIVPLIVPLQFVVLPSDGLYTMNIRLDGRMAKRFPFRAVAGLPQGVREAVIDLPAVN